jgi:hypothetical protein
VDAMRELLRRAHALGVDAPVWWNATAIVMR